MVITAEEKLIAKEEKLLKERKIKLETAIKALGSGKNKIAESLKKKKLKGIPGDSSECIIAVLVKKLFPKATDVEVDGGINVAFDEGDIFFESDALTKFIADFDEEKYPELVRE